MRNERILAVTSVLEKDKSYMKINRTTPEGSGKITGWSFYALNTGFGLQVLPINSIDKRLLLYYYDNNYNSN